MIDIAKLRFNLDQAKPERSTYLIHGNYGVGKTSLLGDMLRTEAATGPVRYINMAGEDGSLSVSTLGLGDIGYTAHDLEEFKAIIDDAKMQGLAAVGIDGFQWLGKFVIRSVCGQRLPSVGKGSDDWQKIHQAFEQVVPTLRWMAPIVMATASSDRSMDQITGEITLTPDLPGRQAAGVGGMFDFVFVLKTRPVNPTKIERYVLTAPVGNMVIRARLPRSLPAELTLPEGPGGWAKIKAAIAACFMPEAAEMALAGRKMK